MPGFALGLVAVFAVAVAGAADHGPAGSFDALAGPGVAVVELFTSQGCSSCPPADRTLEDLTDAAERRGLAVFPLSLHVDYWNRLGWADPYSQAAYSARQQRYAHVLGTGAFTPQVIVNGSAETVGSRERDLTRLVARALAKPAPATVSLDVERREGAIEVRPRVVGAPDGALLWLALTRRSSENPVPRGENAGSDLRHAHVALALREARSGEATRFERPEGAAAAKLSITGFVQDPKTLQILGATRVDAP